MIILAETVIDTIKRKIFGFIEIKRVIYLAIKYSIK